MLGRMCVVMALAVIIFLILFIIAMGFVNLLIKFSDFENNNSDEENKRD